MTIYILTDVTGTKVLATRKKLTKMMEYVADKTSFRIFECTAHKTREIDTAPLPIFDRLHNV